ncbi:transposase [Streptomyces sp. KLMMK]
MELGLPMPAQRKYRDDLRQLAVRMVRTTRERNGTSYGSVSQVAQDLGIGRETLRAWVRQAEIDTRIRPGRSTDDAKRIAELEKGINELMRANRILKEAAGFFMREPDPRSVR